MTFFYSVPDKQMFSVTFNLLSRFSLKVRVLFGQSHFNNFFSRVSCNIYQNVTSLCIANSVCRISVIVVDVELKGEGKVEDLAG